MNQDSAVPIEVVLEIYRRMVRIRQFEDRLYQMFLQGLVPGTLHQYQGQEAIAAGVCIALRPEDVVFSTHRPVGHAIAKGVPLVGIAAELWGKATGCAGGKGGQMHLVDPSVGFPPSSAVVGSNIPMAVGAALGFKLRGLDWVAVSFFGDGASNTGAFHEGLNLAAVKDAPVIFVCENNQYAASTHVSLAMRISDIALRAQAYGFPGLVVDGMDAIAVYNSAYQAINRARSGAGPTLLEYKTFRFMGHSRGDPGGYRSKQEVEQWRSRDPIQRLRDVLTTEYSQPVGSLDQINQDILDEVESAIQFAQTSPDPDPETTYQHVFAD